jgi:uncharacterized protein YjaG (DUF416 family)
MDMDFASVNITTYVNKESAMEKNKIKEHINTKIRPTKEEQIEFVRSLRRAVDKDITELEKLKEELKKELGILE